MSIVANEGKNVLVNYNYMLRVEGLYDLPCKAVHSFTKENEFEYVQEGGLNDYVHMLRKPISKPFTFTVERYVGTDPYPPLPLGAELILPVILMVSPFPDRFDISKRTFVFTGCTVMSKTFGELNAERSGILTETIVIGYREMVEVTVPVHIGEDGSIWAFDEKKVEGKGKRSARTYDRPEEDRVAKKRQWLVENNGVITYVGDQSATDRSKFYEAVSEEDMLEKRYWRLGGPELIAQSVGGNQSENKTEKRVFKKSARTEPDTDAVVRRWNIAGDTKKMIVDGKEVEVPQLGGGEASARTEPDTDAVKRQWLAEEEGIYKNKGKQSARTREDFYKADTEVAEGTDAAADELPRQWLAEEKGIYKNKGKQSARTREDFYKADTEVAEGTEAEVDKLPRQWLAEEKGIYKNKGNQSARTREDFYKVDTEKTEDAEAEENSRQWKMQKGVVEGNGKRSARTETDTEASVRRWNIAGDTKKVTVDGQEVEVPQLGGGEASARILPDTDAVKRQWLAEEKGVYNNKGNQSARTREDFYKVDTEAAEDTEAEENSRQWKMQEGLVEGNGKRSARTETDTDAATRQWKMEKGKVEGGGDRSAKTETDTESEIRQWLAEEKGVYKNKGNQSARTREDFYKADTDTAEDADTEENSRHWKMQEGAVEGNGKRSARTEDDTDPVTRRWKFDDAADKYEGAGDKSRKDGPDTDPETRRWKFGKTANDFEGTGDKSRKTEKGTDLKPRKWEMDQKNPEGKGQRSAATEKKEDPKTRKWQMVDKNKVAGKGTRSAVTEKSSKASGRKWPTVSSAKTQSMKDTEGRRWDNPGDNKLGGGTASAAQSPNSKSERRIWPEQSSAKKRQ